MKSDILLYIDSATSDNDLRFLDSFLPDLLAQRLQKIEAAGTVYYSVPSSYN